MKPPRATDRGHALRSSLRLAGNRDYDQFDEVLPKVADRYRIVSLAGKGGMGEVDGFQSASRIRLILQQVCRTEARKQLGAYGVWPDG